MIPEDCWLLSNMHIRKHTTLMGGEHTPQGVCPAHILIHAEHKTLSTQFNFIMQ